MKPIVILNGSKKDLKLKWVKEILTCFADREVIVLLAIQQSQHVMWRMNNCFDNRSVLGRQLTDVPMGNVTLELKNKDVKEREGLWLGCEGPKKEKGYG
jgi:hypothetical protein